MPGNVWGPCIGTEACNGCDDDVDGRVDEGGASTCSDGVGCTVDACRALLPGVASCVNLPIPAVCRRGACTVGVCAGVAGGTTSPLYATQRTRPLGGAGPTGCTWRESDDWCENEWDQCTCNGWARCDGTRMAGWSGTTPPSTTPDIYATSTASCTDRPPVGPRHEVGDTPGGVLVLCSTDADCRVDQICNAGRCEEIRNGGCESNRNVCTVDRVCLEPFPATSQCRRFNGDSGEALRAAQVQLASFGTTIGTVDGRNVICSTAPIPYPYQHFCQTDGLPCTLPHRPESISCSRLGVCGAQTPAPGGGEEADIIGAFWHIGTLRFEELPGNDCQGFIESHPNSCYQERCGSGTGLCEGFAAQEICQTNATALNAMGAPSCGAPFVCDGLVTSPGPLDPSTTGSFGQIHNGFQGCRRQGFCWSDGQCYPQGVVQRECRICDPLVNSNALLPRTSGLCGPPVAGAPELCSYCSTAATCEVRFPYPPGCSPD
ncbi:MAG: hypothetical protein OHK0013_43440 [Sandaracinaceae bacterium]